MAEVEKAVKVAVVVQVAVVVGWDYSVGMTWGSGHRVRLPASGCS
jgi:hypothetical protein